MARVNGKLNASLSKMMTAFSPGPLHISSDDEHGYQTGIHEGRWAIESRIFIAETLKKKKVLEKFDALASYVVSTDVSRDPTGQNKPPSAVGFDTRAVRFREELIQTARKDLKFRFRWW